MTSVSYGDNTLSKTLKDVKDELKSGTKAQAMNKVVKRGKQEIIKQAEKKYPKTGVKPIDDGSQSIISKALENAGLDVSISDIMEQFETVWDGLDRAGMYIEEKCRKAAVALNSLFEEDAETLAEDDGYFTCMFCGKQFYYQGKTPIGKLRAISAVDRCEASHMLEMNNDQLVERQFRQFRYTVLEQDIRDSTNIAHEWETMQDEVDAEIAFESQWATMQEDADAEIAFENRPKPRAPTKKMSQKNDKQLRELLSKVMPKKRDIKIKRR